MRIRCYNNSAETFDDGVFHVERLNANEVWLWKERWDWKGRMTLVHSYDGPLKFEEIK
jgi:hypothetical protein